MSSEKEREALGDREEEKVALKDDEEKQNDQSFEGEPELDSSKVKFINGGAQAAEAHVDIEGHTKVDDSFQGLSKEELMQYANDPYWVKVRWVLFILFWVAWLAMLVAAIVIIIVAPRCPPRPDLDWWQTSLGYQVYPMSFRDSAGENGVGDLKGVQEKLKYLRKELNVTSVLLGSIYPSPNKDYGYDITDFQDIDSIFGTMEDFEDLRITAHKLGIKVILDFIPNHSSKDHPWFMKSSKKEAGYEDYYVWEDGDKANTRGGRPGEPNNWKSVYGGSAWEWDGNRNQYYLHQFSAAQPDLNLRNEEVLNELDGALRFWLDKGVDGFRVDSAAYLIESEGLEDEPRTGRGPSDDYDYVEHTYTTFQSGTYELITRWRDILDDYSSKNGEKVLIVESYGDGNQTMPFYEYDGKAGAHLPLNFNLLNLKKGCGGQCVHSLVDNWLGSMDSKYWASWLLGNHDHSRVATRLGQEFTNAANMLVMTLPGTAFTYYGEEIGMHDVDISFADTKDPLGKDKGSREYKEYSRDPERTPMQWSGLANAGFTDADTPWLPVASDYITRNVEAQKATGAGDSNLNIYSALTALRQEPSFQWGSMLYAVTTDSIFSYVRQADGFPAYLVAINFGDQPATVNFHDDQPQLVPGEAKIVANTANFPSRSVEEDFEVGEEISLNNIHLRPSEGIIVQWEPAE